MKIKLFPIILVAIMLLLVFPKPAHADGIIVPIPPPCDPGPCPPPPCPWPHPCPIPSPISQLVIRYHRVNVAIIDQVAVTRVDQIFYNPNDWQVEGMYIFPIPVDAAVTSFTLWVDGKPVEGEVLEAWEARRTYEKIVRNLRDPAILEYAGQGAVQAQIFPIPPQGERRIELEYSQALIAEGGLVRYLYPLNTEKFSLWPLEDVSINIDIQSSSVPIRAVYSPSHSVSTYRESDRQVIVGYEASDVLPDTDFALYYSIGENEALHLIPFRDPGNAEPDGFFMLLLAPRPEISQRPLPKDVILVLDRSGSMDGEKFQQAQKALGYILEELKPEDRFNIIAFSTGMEIYARYLRPASEVNEALSWVDRLSAVGSTDINRALLEGVAFAKDERPTYLIFLTDGLPTEGVLDSQKILDNLDLSAPDNVRLFAFGVGYDVDTFLLDSLAQSHHGASTYILPGEHLDEVISSFYEKISTPVLTDLSLEFGNIAVYDIYPTPLPDLFLGSQIIVVGRYRESGSTTITLTGEIDNQIQEFQFLNQQFPTNSQTQASIPRLWATRKIGYLLNQIRLHGPDKETVDQIVRLSIRYGIVTQYTSYLVTEEVPLGEAEHERIAGEQFNQMQTAPLAPSFGREAVEKASAEGALTDAEAPIAPTQEAAEMVRIVGSRTYILSNNVWVDTGFDPQKMKTQKVAFLSNDYFKLAELRVELAAGFALGTRVIALSDGVAYEVVESTGDQDPINIPATFTPVPNKPGPTSTQTINVLYPTDTPTYISKQKPVSGMMPCAGGIFPLVFISLIGYIYYRRGSKFSQKTD